MKEEIDWEQLAKNLGLLEDASESASSHDAGLAIEQLIGTQRLSDSVDYYVAGRKGSELARAVLWRLHPWSAMKRCYEIYKTSENSEWKAAAVELLRVVADKRALKWIKEILEDSNPTIQNWGIGIIDQLTFSGRVFPEDVMPLIEEAEQHSNTYVKEMASKIKVRLNSEIQ